MDAQPGAASRDAGESLADHFRALANDAEHLYGYAMRGMAEVWAAGGPTRSACRGYETAPRSAMIQFRRRMMLATSRAGRWQPAPMPGPSDQPQAADHEQTIGHRWTPRLRME
jgi:hypothetical protein